jgi:protein required for attachment to host cells
MALLMACQTFAALRRLAEACRPTKELQMKKTVTWILIADGTQARVLEHSGPGKGLSTIKDLDWSIPALQSRDINSDGYGRGPNGGAMNSTNSAAQLREADFIKTVAEVIDAKAKDGVFDRLVIAAAPIALGNLRKALSDHAKKAIVAELDKDLTNVPTAQLDKHFDGIFAV